MLKIGDLASVVFAGLSALVIEGVEDEDDLIRVMARTRDEPAPCPVCGALTGRVHGYASRTVTDVPVDGRRVVVSLQVRRLVCPAWGCPRKTFRERVPGLLERYQRRTSRLTGQLGAVVKELADRAGARLSAILAVTISRSTALRLLVRLPLPPLRIPRVLGVDDFALKRRHRYAAILTDAETGERIDVLPGRSADGFAELLIPAEGNDAKLTAWITTIRAAHPPHLHGFAGGLELDRNAVNAALTLPHHNGRTEGVNTRTKRIMRQMHGRAGFDLLRHRILLQ